MARRSLAARRPALSAGGPQIGPARRDGLGLGGLQRFLRIFGGAQGFCEAHAGVRQVLDRRVQLPGQGAQGEQPLLRFLEPVRLEVESRGGGVDGGGGLLGLALGPVHRRRGRFDSLPGRAVGIDASLDRAFAGPLQGAEGLGQAAGQAGAKTVAGGGDVGQGLFGGAQHRPFLGQGRLLALARVQPVEFAEAQGQLLDVGGGPLGQFAQAGFLFARRAPGAPGADTGRRLGLQGAERVQQRAVVARVQQAHRLMLAMHFQQHGAQVAQGSHAGGLVVDEGARAAVGAELAAQHQILVHGPAQPLVVEIGPDGMVARRGEDGGGLSLAGAAPDQSRIGPRAGGQAQSVQNDRFAGPGLAGQGGQPSADREVEGLDQYDVANGEPDQHDPIIAKNLLRLNRQRAS